MKERAPEQDRQKFEQEFQELAQYLAAVEWNQKAMELLKDRDIQAQSKLWNI